MTNKIELMHATAISHDGLAAMIIGPSGVGKSALGLQLLAFGAKLIADDCCALSKQGGQVLVSRPPDLPQMIEARGFGLIPVQCCDATPLRLVVDLEATPTTRFPSRRRLDVLGCDIDVMAKIEGPHFPAAILTYLESCS